MIPPAIFVPPIDEIVDLLHSHAPQLLEQLKVKFPEQKDILRPGMIAGDGLPANMAPRVEAAAAGLKVAKDVCANCIVKVRAKLKLVDRTQLAGQLTTLVAGASIFGVVATTHENMAKIIVAVLALAGSILTFYSQHAMRGFGGQDNNLFTTYSKLVDCQIEANSVSAELEIRKQTGESEQLADLIGRANSLSAEIMRLEGILVI